MSQTKQRVALLIVCLATAIVYLAFPTKVYYWDGVAFAQAIEDAPGLRASLVHPNHLIYNFAGYLFYKLLRAFGADVRALTALQILNSLLSAACAGVLFAILVDTIRSRYLSVCLTFLFAFSATWWKFSTDANAYIPSVLFLLVSFYLSLPNRKPRPLLVALAFFISMAFHQLAVVMFPVMALAIYLQGGPTSPKRRALNAVVFSIAAAVLIVAAYGYLFYLASGSFDFAQLIRWAASYSPDADTKFSLWSNLKYSLRGQVRLFFGGRFNLLKGLINPFVIVLLICLLAAVVALVVEAVRNLGKILGGRWTKGLCLEPAEKSVLLLSLLWVAGYVAFLFVWLPQNTFYRVFYLPALILLPGLALSAFKSRASGERFRTALFVAAVALANFLFLIYPFSHVEKYPPLAFALDMRREWPAATIVYYAANNADLALVRYFNPGTVWKQLDPADLERIEAGSAWLETTAIDRLAATPEGARWLETHTRKDSRKELDDGAYKIRFIRVGSQ